MPGWPLRLKVVVSWFTRFRLAGMGCPQRTPRKREAFSRAGDVPTRERVKGMLSLGQGMTGAPSELSRQFLLLDSHISTMQNRPQKEVRFALEGMTGIEPA